MYDSPSVVESDKLPPPDVAPPDSRSELPRTPESALQLPRSPGNNPSPVLAVGVANPPLTLDTERDIDARLSWSERHPPPLCVANCLRA